MEEDIITLKEQLQQADNFISEFENDCYELAKGIPRKVCERAIKRMNREMKNTPSLGDDFPARFTFFDKLSILLQSHSIDDLVFPNEILREYIENVIEDEFRKLPPLEQLVLNYKVCERNMFNEYCINDARTELFDCFLLLAEEHVECAKIKNYLYR